MRKCIWTSFLSLLIVIFAIFSMQYRVNSCMICDDEIDSFEWFFYEDDSFGKLYEDEGYERRIFMDEFFNIVYEEYSVDLLEAERLLKLKEEHDFVFGSNNYWFNIPIIDVLDNLDSLNININDEDKVLKLQLNSIDPLVERELYKKTQDVLENYELEILAQNIFSVKINLISDDLVENESFENLLTRVNMTFDLSDYAFDNEAFEKLKPVYIDMDKQKVLEIDGQYNASDKSMSINVNEGGIYSLVAKEGFLGSDYYLSQNSKPNLSLDSEYFADQFETEEEPVFLEEKEQKSISPIFLNGAGLLFGVVALVAFVKKKKV